MAFVLDASVAITWAIRDEDHPVADLAFQKIQREPVIVPAIWWYEIRNILLVNERRNRISQHDSERFISLLADFDIEIRPPESSQRIVDLARLHKLSIYDAAYLVLAAEHGIPLATLDEKLHLAAHSVNVPPLA